MMVTMAVRAHGGAISIRTRLRLSWLSFAPKSSNTRPTFLFAALLLSIGSRTALDPHRAFHDREALMRCANQGARGPLRSEQLGHLRAEAVRSLRFSCPVSG